MTRTFILILTAILVSSCGTYVGIRKSRVRYFDSNFSATISNKSFKVKGRQYKDLTLLHLFETPDEGIDTVFIHFKNNTELQFSYLVNGQKREKVFSGHFAKAGYYEIYFRNLKKEIPPFLPILYSNNHINRVRLALTQEGDFIVDNMWDDSGNIFLLAVGNRGRRQSFFKVQTR